MNTIILTGVSRGFGLSLSQALDSPENQIIGFGRTQGEFNGQFHFCDLAQTADVKNAVSQGLASSQIGESDQIVFIHNAGILGPLGKIEDLAPSAITTNINSNLTATAIALSTFLKLTATLNCPKLFINISSGAALPERTKPGWALYCAAKAGQAQLVRTVAKEQDYSKSPSSIINFDPGVMETQMQEIIRSTPESAFPEVSRFQKLKEDGKVPSPDTIAQKLANAIRSNFNFDNGATYSSKDL